MMQSNKSAGVPRLESFERLFSPHRSFEPAIATAVSEAYRCLTGHGSDTSSQHP